MFDNPFTVERQNGHVVVTAKIDVLKDLIQILEYLLELSQQIKRYRTYEEAERKAVDPVLLAKREAEFKEKSKKTYLTFKEHLKNDCRGNKSEAIKKTYKELGILRIDTEFFIAEGKRMEKKEQKTKALTTSSYSHKDAFDNHAMALNYSV